MRAKIESIDDVGNGTADLTVSFLRDDGTLLSRRSFNLHKESFPTAKSVRDFILSEKAKMQAFSDVVDTVKSLIGQEV